MVEATKGGQGSISTFDYVKENGHFPLTVCGHNRLRGATELITTTKDPEQNIMVHDDPDIDAHQVGEEQE